MISGVANKDDANLRRGDVDRAVRALHDAFGLGTIAVENSDA